MYEISSIIDFRGKLEQNTHMNAMEEMRLLMAKDITLNGRIKKAEQEHNFDVWDGKLHEEERKLYEKILKERGKIVWETIKTLSILWRDLEKDFLTNQSPTQTAPSTRPIISQITPATSWPKILAVSRSVPPQEAEVAPIVTNRSTESNDDLAIAKRIVDMIIYFEGPGWSRQPDRWGGFDIGGGINTGGFASVEERNFVLNGRTDWYNSYIPTSEVKACVTRLLTRRIQITKDRYRIRTWRDDFGTLPSSVQAVLVDLHYNMPSVSAPGKFPQFWDAIKTKNWQEAGRQLVDNGKGTPSLYLRNVLWRAYSNAMMLTAENQEYKEYKGRAERAGSAEAIFDLYNQENGKYGKRFSRVERREELQEMSTVADLLEVTTSPSAMSSRWILGNKWSTRAIIDVLDKFIDQHSRGPAEKAALEWQVKEQLKIKFGNFKRPIFEDGSAMGAFQQWYYLQYGEKAFKESVQYIDGTRGPLIENAFLRECYKVRGTDILRRIQSQADVRWLPQFERDILLTNLPGETKDVGEGSGPEKIRLAQILENLQWNPMAINGIWNDKINSLFHGFNREKALSIIRWNLDISDLYWPEALTMLKDDFLFLLADLAQKFKLSGSRIEIISAYRDEARNARVWGANRSSHKNGKAFDIRTRWKTSAEIASWQKFFKDQSGSDNLFIDIHDVWNWSHLHVWEKFWRTYKYSKIPS